MKKKVKIDGIIFWGNNGIPQAYSDFLTLLLILYFYIIKRFPVCVYSSISGLLFFKKKKALVTAH